MRDVKPAAEWRAEEIRAKESGDDFDLETARSGVDIDPFDWNLYDDKTLFVAWSAATGKRMKVKYHLTNTSIHTLLRVLGGVGK